MHTQLPPGQSPETFDFAAALRTAVGADTAFEILSAASWRAGQALVAEQFGAGRVVLAGDECHLFTPTGGFGVNTGVEDAVNLAWKLAAVCQGWGGDDLLNSYHSERHAIAVRNTGAALNLARAVGACPIPPWIEDEGSQGEQAREAAAHHIAAFARAEFDTPAFSSVPAMTGLPRS